MTLHIQFSPEIEAKLRERAEATGKSVDQVIREAVEQAVEMSPPMQQQITPEERARRFAEWIASHPKREGVTLDDSRESIYSGRGE